MPQTLIEFLNIFKDSLLVIATGFVTLLAAGRQIQAQNRQAHDRLMMEKIERASALRQQVYDGHWSQRRNFRMHWIGNREQYFIRDKHPGAEMNELKTIVRCYFPELLPQLEKMDAGHGPLKEQFRELSDGAAMPTADDRAEFAALRDSIQVHFLKMEGGTTVLKKALANEANRYIRRRRWPQVRAWFARTQQP